MVNLGLNEHNWDHDWMRERERDHGMTKLPMPKSQVGLGLMVLLTVSTKVGSGEMSGTKLK